MSIRTKFYLFFAVGISLVIAICAYAVVSYNSITANAEDMEQTYSKRIIAAHNIQSRFDKQIHEWKNILLRGDDRHAFELHASNFFKEEAHVKAISKKLLANLDDNSTSQNLIETFIDRHQFISELYRTAFAVIENSPVDAFLYADVVVREIEKQPRELIEQVIDALVNERTQTQLDVAAQRSGWEYKIILVVLASILLTSITFSLFLNHQVILPLSKLSHRAKRLSEGYYDESIDIDSNSESSDVANALNVLSKSMSDYTNYMEDSLKQLTRLATELADSNELIVHKEARIKAIVDNMADGVITLRSDQRIEMFNPAACKIFGYTCDEIIDRQVDVLFDTNAKIKIYENEGPNLVQEVRGIRSDGRTFLMDCVVSEFCVDEVSHYVLSVRDVTLRKLTEQKLVQLANYDSLTHLPNRNMLHTQLKTSIELTSYKTTSLALLHVNVDNFLRINETFGYMVGDHLLKQIAARLKTACPGAQLVARLGGDEFALIIDNVADVNTALHAVDSVLNIMKQPFSLSGHEIYANCSIGVALYPNDAVDADELLRQANIAVHHAKSQGHGQCCFYSKDMEVCALEKIQLDGRIRQAVAKNEFLFHYQPQIDIVTNEVVGVEALLRWNDRERGLIPPIEFIPLLEESGLILQLGEHLLTQACIQGQVWHEAGYRNLTVSINLSARQFEDPNLLTMVKRVLAETRFNPRKLELEITESAIMGDASKSEQILKLLTAMGISVAIDDFGTGYSSLSYLRSFSLQTLKIDRSFVKEIDVRADDQAISQSIINMAHNLKMDVVAEGVETQKQADVLKQLGCRVVQGYFYSKPLSPDDVTRFLWKSRHAENFGDESKSKDGQAVTI